MLSSMFPFGIFGVSMTHGYILIVSWCLLLNHPLQDSSKNLSLSIKQVAETKRKLASEHDAGLPNFPFANWFGQTVEREAGFNSQDNHSFLNGFQAIYQQRVFAVSLSGGI
jgi:hypothetical protein